MLKRIVYRIEKFLEDTDAFFYPPYGPVQVYVLSFLLTTSSIAMVLCLPYVCLNVWYSPKPSLVFVLFAAKYVPLLVANYLVTMINYSNVVWITKDKILDLIDLQLEKTPFIFRQFYITCQWLLISYQLSANIPRIFKLKYIYELVLSDLFIDIFMLFYLIGITSLFWIFEVAEEEKPQPILYLGP